MLYLECFTKLPSCLSITILAWCFNKPISNHHLCQVFPSQLKAPVQSFQESPLLSLLFLPRFFSKMDSLPLHFWKQGGFLPKTWPVSSISFTETQTWDWSHLPSSWGFQSFLYFHRLLFLAPLPKRPRLGRCYC